MCDFSSSVLTACQFDNISDFNNEINQLNPVHCLAAALYRNTYISVLLYRRMRILYRDPYLYVDVNEL